MGKVHSATHSVSVSSSGYLITPVISGGAVTVTFWMGGGSSTGTLVGFNSNTTATMPSASSASQNFTNGTQTFKTVGTSYLQSFSVMTTANTPLQLGIFNGTGSTVYLDDIVITSTSLVCSTPTLKAVSTASNCNSNNATIDLQGLTASTIDTVFYNLGGGTTKSAIVNSTANGTGSFTLPVSLANNGQTLSVTSITSGTCSSNFSIGNSTTILVNSTVTDTVNLSGCSSVTYNTIVYSTSTKFTDTIKNNGGCDSLYHIVNITLGNCGIVVKSFSPLTAASGATVTIAGTGFTGATAVSFGGTTAASFAVVNDSTLTAVVGSGTSGSVSVTTPKGSGSLAGFTYTSATGNLITGIQSTTPFISAGTNVTAAISNGAGILQVPKDSSTGIIFGSKAAGLPGWAADGTTATFTTAESKGEWVQFAIAPATGNNLTINGFNIKGLSSSASTSNFYGVAYAIGDTSLFGKGTCTFLDSAGVAGNNANITAGYIASGAFTTGQNIVVNNGGTIYIRVYLWRKNTASSSSQFTISDFSINGTVTSAGGGTPTSSTTNASICYGSSYLFNGTSYTATGTYTSHLTNSTGADSAATLNLTVGIAPVKNTTTLNGCDSVVFKGISYKSSTVITDTIKTRSGNGGTSQSIIYFHEGFNNTTGKLISSSTDSSLVQGKVTANWEVADSGTWALYGAYRTTGSGCANYGAGHLRFLKYTDGTKPWAVSPIVNNGIGSFHFSSTTTGKYFRVQWTADTAALTTNWTTTLDSVIVSSCKDTGIYINQPTAKRVRIIDMLVAAGYQTDFDSVWITSYAVAGGNTGLQCDSVYNVTNIVVNKANKTTVNASIAGCNSVQFNNKNYTSSTIVSDTVRSINGCDSIYHVTNITVNKITATSDSIKLSGCNSILYKNINYYSSKSFIDTLRSLGGCDSIYHYVNLIVNLPTNSTTYIIATGLPYSWNGNSYSAVGIYTIHITNSVGCDSAATLNLTFNANSINVSGYILTPLGKSVPLVTANLSGSSIQSNIASGLYSFSLAANTNGAIKLYKNNDINKDNGVSGIDVAFIQSHILSRNLLSSPYKIIAADVNGDGKVSAIDIVYLKRLILGMDTTFTNSATKQNRLWTFVDSTYSFPNPTNPYPLKDSIGFTNISSGLTNQSFTAIKLGDVNWDWDPALARPVKNTMNAVVLSYPTSIFQTYDEVRIPVSVKNFKEMLTMQFTINFDASVLKWKGINNNLLNFDLGNNHAEEGRISFLWNDPANEVKTLEDGTVLFELVFQKINNRQLTIDNGNILSMDGSVTKVEAYDKDYLLHGVVLNKIENISVVKENWSVVPNPITDGLIHVKIFLKDKRKIVFRLLDISGKVILSKPLEGEKGSNTFILKAGGKVSSGVYFLKAEGIEGIKQLIINN